MPTHGFLHDGPTDGPVLLLAHGAGAPMDSGFMTAMAGLLADRQIHVVRFEFSYMAERRTHGRKRPPAKLPILMDELRQAMTQLTHKPLFIGGKSMGGRVASMVAAEALEQAKPAGLVCLGYPFHPPGKPEKLRTAHLEDIACPTLIVQGERDPFGTRSDIASYHLSEKIGLFWAAAGNHDLVPPKRSGLTGPGNWEAAANAIAGFIRSTQT